MQKEYRWIKINPHTISQTGLVFQYYTFGFPDILDWLQNECKWKHDCSMSNVTKVRVEFFDAAGAVEFKLRFMPENELERNDDAE